MLIPLRHIEDCTPSRHIKPLMAIAHEEVRVEGGEVQRDMADSMGPINKTEDAFFFADRNQSLKWHAVARHRSYGIEDSELRVVTLGAGLLHCGSEEVKYKGVRAGES